MTRHTPRTILAHAVFAIGVLAVGCTEARPASPATPARVAAAPADAGAGAVGAVDAGAPVAVADAGVADAGAPPDPPPVVATTSPCEPEPRFDRPPRQQPRFGTGLRGKSRDAVRAKHGEPTWCKSPALWRYAFPSGCSYERVVLSVWFGKRGVVTRTTEVRFITGEHCL